MSRIRYQKTLTISVTPEQYAAIRRAVNKAGVKSLSSMVRDWLEDYCTGQGIDWPDDEHNWGGPRTPNSEGLDD